MTGWTNEATEYLDGYLTQVAVLAKLQGDDADDIVNGLRDHIDHEVHAATDGTIGIDTLLVVLETIGAPSDVASMDAPIRYETTSPPKTPAEIGRDVRPKSKSSVALMGCGGIMVIAVIFSVLGLMGVVITNIVDPEAFSNNVIVGKSSYETFNAHGQALNPSNNIEYRAECAARLKKIYDGLVLYAAAHDGLLPPMSMKTSQPMFDIKALYPKYIESESTLTCPVDEIVGKKSRDGDIHQDQSFLYLSHGVYYEPVGEKFINAYTEAFRSTQPLPDMIDEKSNDPLFRLGTTMIKDSPEVGAMMPILIEEYGKHQPPGGHVLFLDGHVEYIDLDEKFPMTTSFIQGLNSIKGKE